MKMDPYNPHGMFLTIVLLDDFIHDSIPEQIYTLVTTITISNFNTIGNMQSKC